MTNKVAFIHINRTAGSTFRRILQTLFGDAYHFVTEPAVSGVEAAIARYGAVEFHVVVTEKTMFMSHEQMALEDRWDLLNGSQVFVLFREPVDYYVSSFHHSLQRRQYVEPALKARGFNFPETLEEMMGWPQTFNAELAFFLGIRRDTGYCVTRKDLERAKELLRRPNFHCGTTERFGDFVHILERETGMKIPGEMILNVNRNPNRPALDEVPAEVKERIRTESALDYELYEFAQEKFEEDFAQCGAISDFMFAEEPVPELQGGNVAASDVKTPRSLWDRIRGAVAFR